MAQLWRTTDSPYDESTAVGPREAGDNGAPDTQAAARSRRAATADVVGRSQTRMIR